MFALFYTSCYVCAIDFILRKKKKERIAPLFRAKKKQIKNTKTNFE